MSRYARSVEDLSPVPDPIPVRCPVKRKRGEPVAVTDENMSDNSTERNKRANFSAIASIGLNRNLNILNLKPTTTKKIVIKNLKSK